MRKNYFYFSSTMFVFNNLHSATFTKGDIFRSPHTMTYAYAQSKNALSTMMIKFNSRSVAI